ncbi:MAG: FG-GAP repeat protein, partial [Chloroflexi bacterium]|nr:FG-GAP repeat protein [Chloroflexota bacterium]
MSVVLAARLHRVLFVVGLILLAAFALPSSASAASLSEIKQLTASDAQAGELFGTSVGIDGDTAIVGAMLADIGGGGGGSSDGSSAGEPPTPTPDPVGGDAGAAYIFQRSQGGAGNWGEVKKLTPSTVEFLARFGFSVAISGDIAVVGERADRAYVFQRDQGGADNWGEVKKLLGSDTGDGNQFGHSVAVSGDTIIVGARNANPIGQGAGAAYIFQRDEGGADNWGEVKKLNTSDPAPALRFGTSVAIDGDTAVIGADLEATTSGAAYVFERDVGGADNWGEVKKLKASDPQDFDHFGSSVAVSGDTVLSGARSEDAGGDDAGAAYVFQRGQGGADNWGQVKKLTASDAQADDHLGISVALSGDTAVVGADNGDSGLADSGAVYVFQRNAGGADNWGQDKKLVASNAGQLDEFGGSLSISGGTALVGAPRQNGIDFDTGAAYVFQAPAPPVGGVALGPDVRSLPLETAGPDSPTWGFMVAIVVAAGLTTVGSAVLYVRRRAAQVALTAPASSSAANRRLGVAWYTR